MEGLLGIQETRKGWLPFPGLL
ncbi:MAG: hypothetical protein FD129_2117, partial [bacterium]